MIIGIDPGSTITGYALLAEELVDYGTIRPPKKAKLSERRLIIYEAIAHLIEKYGPSAMAIETQFVRANPQTAIKLGMVRGIAILAASQVSIPIYEYAPSKAKLAATGKGSASKQQVQQMVQRLHNLSKVSEDEADAIAIAMGHQNAMRLDLNLGVQV